MSLDFIQLFYVFCKKSAISLETSYSSDITLQQVKRCIMCCSLRGGEILLREVHVKSSHHCPGDEHTGLPLESLPQHTAYNAL